MRTKEEVRDAVKAPWYAVPAYKGGGGIDGQPHVVNRDGELVGTFEMQADANITATAVNFLLECWEDLS